MERHAVQGAELVAARDGGIGGFRIAQGLIGADGDEAVERPIGLLGPRQGGAHDLRGGDLLRPDQPSELGGGGVGQFVCHVR